MSNRNLFLFYILKSIHNHALNCFSVVEKLLVLKLDSFLITNQSFNLVNSFKNFLIFSLKNLLQFLLLRNNLTFNLINIKISQIHLIFHIIKHFFLFQLFLANLQSLPFHINNLILNLVLKHLELIFMILLILLKLIIFLLLSNLNLNLSLQFLNLLLIILINLSNLLNLFVFFFLQINLKPLRFLFNQTFKYINIPIKLLHIIIHLFPIPLININYINKCLPLVNQLLLTFNLTIRPIELNLSQFFHLFLSRLFLNHLWINKFHSSFFNLSIFLSFTL